DLSHKMPIEPSNSMQLTIELLNESIKKLPVDKKRIYVTGLSMGGFGTWDIVQRMPKIFAAAMPVCGGGDAELASEIKTVPIWVFHGGSDNVVKTKRSQDMVTALEKVGSKVKYTEYEGVGHNSWDRTYRDENALRWLFHQKKGKQTDGLGEK
ncbi:prolyl oligopeptidase family serine peptidase, partial [Akkermansiaceae bacterium]|nr:prolyl oligopeptidase family serine peptidase [Akkermansiaceae bacterium]